MDILTAHALFARQQEAHDCDQWPGPRELRSSITAPLELVGLTIISGMLPDCTDVAGLLEAAAHGWALFNSETIPASDFVDAANSVYQALDDEFRVFAPVVVDDVLTN